MNTIFVIHFHALSDARACVLKAERKMKTPGRQLLPQQRLHRLPLKNSVSLNRENKIKIIIYLPSRISKDIFTAQEGINDGRNR